MWAKFTVILALVSVALCRPQFIGFKDGRIGVGFGGYHASAGLGGGNGAGGLFAEAGTPTGQRAGAGLGGSYNGQTRGGGYAGATAGNGIGASAALGGNPNYGGVGAEAHANGQSTKVVKLAQAESQPVADDSLDTRFDTNDDDDTTNDEVNTVPQQTNVQKVNRNGGQPQVIYQKRVTVQQLPIPDSNTQTVTKTKQVTGPVNNFDISKFFDFGYFSNLGASYAGGPTSTGGNQDELNTRFDAPAKGNNDVNGETNKVNRHRTIFDDIFNIPIQTLMAVNQLVNAKAGQKNGSYSVTKTATY